MNIIGMMILHVPLQTCAAWQLPSLSFVNQQVSRKSLILGSVVAAATMGWCIWRLSAEDKVKQAQRELAVILQSKPNCRMERFEFKKGADVRKYTNLIDIPLFLALQGAVANLEKNGQECVKGLILYQDEAPIGFVSYKNTYYPELRFTHYDRQATIDLLGVKESHQGKGFGELLMKYVMCLIAHTDGKSIKLIASADHNTKGIAALCRFYEKLGFKKFHPEWYASEYPRYIYTINN